MNNPQFPGTAVASRGLALLLLSMLMIAAAAVQAQTAATPAPGPVSRPPLGAKPTPVRAKVEAEAVVMTPLVKGAKVWADRDYQFVFIPPSLDAMQFTQSKAHARTLRFKVLSDGLVEMACTSRFAETDPEAMTDEKLRRKGWRRKRGEELRDGQPGYVWWIYARQCKAGESFSYHTEKYAPPFLLVK